MVHSSRRIAAYGLLSFFVLSILAVALLGSMSAMAGLGPKAVQGYVYDNAGNLLGGATVTVQIIDKTTHVVRDTQTNTTGSDGYYSVSFAPDKWDIGDNITAKAIYGSVQSEQSKTLASAASYQDLDIHFTTAIPQFGSVLGFGLAAGFVFAVGLAFVSLRRKR